jgi:aspartyl protease family protein
MAMLLRTLVFASLAVLLATQIPAVMTLVDRVPENVGSTAETPTSAKAQPASIAPGRVRLSADGRGHFSGQFRINGKTVQGLVDTGASAVTINESTARKLGFGVNSLDFRYQMNTANGKTAGALITLDRIEIGNVRVRQVEAFVLRDDALSGTLIGMTFLKKLRSFQVEDGSLTLIP